MTYRKHPVGADASVVDADAQLIDVREHDEFAAGSIDGAVNIPLSELDRRVAELDSGRRTVVFCRSGVRSSQAAEYLAHRGFADVVNLEGGMLAYNERKAS